MDLSSSIAEVSSELCTCCSRQDTWLSGCFNKVIRYHSMGETHDLMMAQCALFFVMVLAIIKVPEKDLWEQINGKYSLIISHLSTTFTNLHCIPFLILITGNFLTIFLLVWNIYSLPVMYLQWHRRMRSIPHPHVSFQFR